MPRSSSSGKSANAAKKKKKPPASASAPAKNKTKKKQPAKKKPLAKKPAPKSKVISHTDDGTPIVNATLTQIRRGVSGSAPHQLVRVLVADAQHLVRTGLRMILDAQPDIDVVGEAGDGREAVRLANERQCGVLLYTLSARGGKALCLVQTRRKRSDRFDPLREIAQDGEEQTALPLRLAIKHDHAAHLLAHARARASDLVPKTCDRDDAALHHQSVRSRW